MAFTYGQFWDKDNLPYDPTGLLDFTKPEQWEDRNGTLQWSVVYCGKRISWPLLAKKTLCAFYPSKYSTDSLVVLFCATPAKYGGGTGEAAIKEFLREI